MNYKQFVKYILVATYILVFSISVRSIQLNGQEFLVTNENIEVLNSRTVHSIIQDKTGFIWFGTNEGLFRYDGTEAKGYYSERGESTSLSSSFIRSLYEDEDGIIWIGTYSGGLNRFDPIRETFTHFKNDPLDSTSICVNSIHGISEDINGNIWMATFGGGICVLSQAEKGKSKPKFKTLKKLQGGRLVNLIIDKKKEVWVTSSENYIFSGPINFQNILDTNIDTVKIGNDPLLVNSSMRGSQMMTRVNEDKLWIASESNTKIIAFNTLQNPPLKSIEPLPYLQQFSDLSINSIVSDGKQNVWISTDQGIYVSSIESGLHKTFHLIPGTKDFDSNNMALDQNNNLWIAANEGGIKKVYLKKPIKYYNTSDPFFKVKGDIGIHCIQLDEQHLMMGTWGNGGLYIYNQENNRVQEISPPRKALNPRMNIDHLYVDNDQQIWVSTLNYGLLKYDRKKSTLTPLPIKDKQQDGLSASFVQGVLQDSNNHLWIATEGGLDFYDPENRLWKHFTSNLQDSNSISNNRIQTNAFLFDKKGFLWFGTWGGGVNCFDTKNETSQHLRFDPNNNLSIPKDEVTALELDQEGHLWVGTFEGGLARSLHSINQGFPTDFEGYTIQDGLPGNSIYDIIEDSNGTIWVSTNSGFASINPKTGAINSFGKEDGNPIINHYFANGSVLKDGSIVFGGNSGFVHFHPDSLHKEATPYPLVFTEFRTNQKDFQLDSSINHKQHIKLNHPTNSFSIGFAALNFGATNNLEYAYQLEGLETDWNYVGNRRVASYQNLDYGTFTFKVKLSNKIGLSFVKAVTIEVTPPWWERGWFVVSVILIALSIPVLFFLNRYFLIRSHNKDLALKIKQRTQEIQLLNNQLLKKNDELEERVQQRTLELELSNKELIEKNKALERFTFIASHDLKEPLRNISSFSSLVKKRMSNVKGEIGEFLTIIQHNAHRMHTLIEDILEYSRISNHSKRLDSISTIEIVKEIEERTNTLLKEKNGQLVYEQLPRIRGDRTQTYLLFKNLIENGIKYNESIHPVVQIEYKQFGQKHQFTFIDNGIGIPTEYHSSIFNMFTRLHDRSKYDGSGLGLSICKNIIHKQGGEIQVLSEPNKGSRFVVLLPIS